MELANTLAYYNMVTITAVKKKLKGHNPDVQKLLFQEENLKLRSENSVLGQYIENLMQARCQCYKNFLQS
jgi:hypothetical protein